MLAVVVGFSHADFKAVFVHDQASFTAELTQVHAARNRPVVG